MIDRFSTHRAKEEAGPRIKSGVAVNFYVAYIFSSPRTLSGSQLEDATYKSGIEVSEIFLIFLRHFLFFRTLMPDPREDVIPASPLLIAWISRYCEPADPTNAAAAERKRIAACSAGLWLSRLWNDFTRRHEEASCYLPLWLRGFVWNFRKRAAPAMARQVLTACRLAKPTETSEIGGEPPSK
ncbi:MULTISPECIES: hypothetical protein [unclassified Novosphingobium]|uniref:hypothetical protein n=1 Tax=unclassified Novosphingobium TaxID=2644732 RepID=UPI00149450E5|nr:MULTISPECIES: hypothetical protein [unclassified Novosphingobium]MBB3356877.1 hypothetical protein [Novosphingobium sp. BK256]MBB3373278.1 hypothetical protein [Novosphingobium sp. BK280]MBB3377647.1 hypothetical protein [Novosphingobium sp. BK258]MBB3418942.1 hypothetical protein [Novosphingobium sp. BK267]MBB3450223.1 hypothetical protein [Novosphingobium sp. BK352]